MLYFLHFIVPLHNNRRLQARSIGQRNLVRISANFTFLLRIYGPYLHILLWLWLTSSREFYNSVERCQKLKWEKSVSCASLGLSSISLSNYGSSGLLDEDSSVKSLPLVRRTSWLLLSLQNAGVRSGGARWQREHPRPRRNQHRCPLQGPWGGLQKDWGEDPRREGTVPQMWNSAHWVSIFALIFNERKGNHWEQNYFCSFVPILKVKQQKRWGRYIYIYMFWYGKIAKIRIKWKDQDP